MPLFNQYAGPNRLLSFEINSFDQYCSHPARQGDCHYHVKPTYLTKVKLSKSALLGFYSMVFRYMIPKKIKKMVTEEMLDEYN